MAVFVQLVTSSSMGINLNGKEDTGKVNKVLANLQSKKAKIISVTSSVSGGVMGSAAVYVITYESPEMIKV
ncbi:MAG: hypothetical protein ABIB93_06080 [Chloroflexota bacterium]